MRTRHLASYGELALPIGAHAAPTLLCRYLANIPVASQLDTGKWPAMARLGRRLGFPVAYKQLNLTAWTDGAAAGDWYRSSAEHGAIVEAHRTGMLTSFSSMVANLAPTSRPRWDARCPECALPNPRYPEVRVCRHCGAVCREMPLF